MSQDLASLLDEIRVAMLELPGMPRVYPDVPESINEWPAVVVASTGLRSWLTSHDHTTMTEHDIRVEVHVPRKDLPIDHLQMAVLADEAAYALYRGFVTDQFGGTMVTTSAGGQASSDGVGAPLDGSIGSSSWNEQLTYAFMCNFKVVTERKILP